MERGHKRSKSSSAYEGFPQVQKYRAVNRLPSDYGSYDNSGIRNDKSVEIGQSSVGGATDRPSTYLLAGRINEETAPKKRSLRGIARLLRGEGLPSPWNTRKLKKSLSDSCRPDDTSINNEPNRQLYDGQPIRRSPKKQEELEDVYEYLDESSSVDGCYSSRWSSSSLLSQSEMALIQKNLESKRLTYDETIGEKFYDSEELYGMLGSRVLRKQFGRKNSSFVNHVYDQLGTSTSSLGSPTAPLNPPISEKYGSAKSGRADEDITGKHNITYHRNSDDVSDACESEDEIYSGLGESPIEETPDGELEMFKPSSRITVGDNMRGSHPSSRSFDEEAKKRLAERWKLTHRYGDLEIVGMGSTLGEMLSIPHGDQKSMQTAYSRIGRSSLQMGAGNRSSTRHGRGGITRGRGTSKVSKPHPSPNDHFSQGLKFKGKKPLPCEEMHSSVEARFEIQMEANVKDLPPQQLTFQMAEKDDCCISDDVSEIGAAEAEHGITTLLSRTSLLHSNHSSVDNKSTGSTADDQKVFCPQELNEGVSEEIAPSSKSLEAEPVSSGSSKDAEHASPISVFGTPFVEDASSRSESLEKVSAEVNDLTMQLHLLKMDCSAYDNTSTHITTEKDTIRAESWVASYTLDVLILAGLQNFDFDLFRIMWHTPYHPLDSMLFYILEEKYCSNEMAGSTSRQQRMLLFDTINSALSDIFLKHVDILPWAMPKLAGLMQLTRQKERARYNVERLIGSANGLHVTERLLDTETHWPDPTEEIALTGNKIEELLLDDLINEFLFDQR